MHHGRRALCGAWMVSEEVGLLENEVGRVEIVPLRVRLERAMHYAPAAHTVCRCEWIPWLGTLWGEGTVWGEGGKTNLQWTAMPPKRR